VRKSSELQPRVSQQSLSGKAHCRPAEAAGKKGPGKKQQALNKLWAKSWVVDIEAPIDRPEIVLIISKLCEQPKTGIESPSLQFP
jgi:hypothetical protein